MQKAGDPATMNEQEKSEARLADCRARLEQSQIIAPHRIPTRTSSCLTPRARHVSQTLSDRSAELREKISNVSLTSSSGSTRSQDFLGMQKALLESQSEEWKIVEDDLIEQMKDMKMEKKDFTEQQAIVQKHRTELVVEEIALERNHKRLEQHLNAHDELDWPRIYMDMMSKLFNDTHPENARHDLVHDAWKKAIRRYYNSYNPLDTEQTWCPILATYYQTAVEMKAAHIVPHFMGISTVGYIFGEPGNGYNLLWHTDNGIMMRSWLEKSFDRGDWILIGHPQPEGAPIEYEFVLLNEKLGKSAVEFSLRYNDLDGRKLVWKNERRPDAKYVYWHFATSLLRNYKKQTPGILEKIEKLVRGIAWGNSGGQWYDKSTLKQMAEYWGIWDKNLWDGKEKTTDAGEEDIGPKLRAGSIFASYANYDDPVRSIEDEKEL